MSLEKQHLKGCTKNSRKLRKGSWACGIIGGFWICHNTHLCGVTMGMLLIMIVRSDVSCVTRISWVENSKPTSPHQRKPGVRSMTISLLPFIIFEIFSTHGEGDRRNKNRIGVLCIYFNSAGHSKILV